MQLLDIPVSLIDAPTVGRRDESGDLRDLAVDIVRNGLLNPIYVRTLADNRYEVIVGKRRFFAHQLAGLEFIRAFVVECSDEQAEIMNLSENINRADVTYTDMANSFKRLSDQNDGDVRLISATTKYSTALIRQYLAISHMDAGVLRTAEFAKEKANTLNLDILRHIATKFEQSQHFAAFQALVNGGLSVERNSAILRSLPEDSTITYLTNQIIDAQAASVDFASSIRNPRNGSRFVFPADLTPAEFDDIRTYAMERLARDRPDAPPLVASPMYCRVCMEDSQEPGYMCPGCRRRLCQSCTSSLRKRACPFCHHPSYGM